MGDLVAPDNLLSHTHFVESNGIVGEDNLHAALMTQLASFCSL